MLRIAEPVEAVAAEVVSPRKGRWRRCKCNRAIHMRCVQQDVCASAAPAGAEKPAHDRCPRVPLARAAPARAPPVATFARPSRSEWHGVTSVLPASRRVTSVI